MYVLSSNSGPRIRVHAGADFVFMYGLIFLHKANWDVVPISTAEHWPRPKLAHTLCSCRNCISGGHHVREPNYPMNPPAARDGTANIIDKKTISGGSPGGDCKQVVASAVNRRPAGATSLSNSHGGRPGLKVDEGRVGGGDSRISFGSMIEEVALTVVVAMVGLRWCG